MHTELATDVNASQRRKHRSARRPVRVDARTMMGRRSKELADDRADQNVVLSRCRIAVALFSAELQEAVRPLMFSR
jgi:hypothetical protein